MKAGSSIINTTSIQAFQPSENLLAYAATKAAIANLTKSLAKLAGKRGIRVNGVAPGPLDAADTLHHGSGKNQRVWQKHCIRATSSAGRTGQNLCFFGVGRLEFCFR
jgi:NAD(P)-dependent dehydrogenase (short-subunit alcohol dehydrogenase family)